MIRIACFKSFPNVPELISKSPISSRRIAYIQGKTKGMQKFICFLFLLIFSSHAFSQQNYPIPSETNNLLFFIQHNQGTNTFIYSLNYDKKKKSIHEREPIKITRQLFDNNGEIKPLTNIQRKFAYGVRSKKPQNNQIEFEIVSLSEQKFQLDIQNPQQVKVTTMINGEKLEVERIYLMLKDGTSGLNTKVDYILFYGTINKKPTVKKLIP